MSSPLKQNVRRTATLSCLAQENRLIVSHFTFRQTRIKQMQKKKWMKNKSLSWEVEKCVSNTMFHKTKDIFKNSTKYDWDFQVFWLNGASAWVVIGAEPNERRGFQWLWAPAFARAKDQLFLLLVFLSFNMRGYEINFWPPKQYLKSIKNLIHLCSHLTSLTLISFNKTSASLNQSPGVLVGYLHIILSKSSSPTENVDIELVWWYVQKKSPKFQRVPTLKPLQHPLKTTIIR